MTTIEIDRSKYGNGSDSDDKKMSKPPNFGDNLSQRELKNAVEEYAEWFVSNKSALKEVDLGLVTFGISTQFKRAAGKAGWKESKSNQRLRMAWKAYQKWGWNKEWRKTIEHELIHIWELQVHGKAGHGTTFKRKADEIGAERHCPQFAEYKYKFVCKNCGDVVDGRFRKCKATKHPELLNSNCCDGNVKVVQ